MIPDAINGTFELLGGAFIGLSIRRLYRDKHVAGFHWGHLSFFTLWGIWNLYYYTHLGQWWSFVGGLGVVAANMIYLGMIIHYRRGLCDVCFDNFGKRVPAVIVRRGVPLCEVCEGMPVIQDQR